MRFGKTLRLATYQPWSDNYIDYGKLKKLLRDDDDDSAPSSPSTENKDVWTEKDEGAFVDELVNKQLEKVHAFHADTFEKLRERTAKCEARLDAVAAASTGVSAKDQAQEGAGSHSGSGKKPMPSQEQKRGIAKEVLGELDQITKEINELEKYSRINYTGFLKAAKKHDRKRGDSYRVRPLLQVRLAALPFNKEDYSPLLHRLSAMYSFARQDLEGTDKRAASSAESNAGKEEYVSHKFWVHPENLLEVKTMILRRLPMLVYNPQTSKVAEGNEPDPTITSIYFDNPSFDLYSHKVDHGEASSLRTRWYGQLSSQPKVFIEKKTVKEDGSSSEAKFTAKDKYVQGLVKGDYHMEKQIQKLEARAGAESEEAQNLKSSVEEIQSFIKENKLQPVLRANYHRTAFQIPGDDRVRVSLDTDLAFIREDAIDADRPCRDPESWHRPDIDNAELSYPFSSVRKGEVNRFPFALLEIKLRNSGRRSEWIQDIMNSHLVREAPRFSKFVHGVAQLFEDYVNTFPFWLSTMETDIRRDPQQAFQEEQAKRQKELDDDVAVGSFLKSGSASTQKQPRPPGIISPVGSPNIPSASSLSRNVNKRPSRRDLSASATIPEQAPDQENTANEPDEDETGAATYTFPPTDSARPKNPLTNFLPSLSTSKYALARRSRTTQPSHLPPGVETPTHWIKDAGPLKVEAKVWLANQRTFIKWQHVSVLLATLSLALYNAAGEYNSVARGLAVVYTALAVFAGAWGYGVYLWRMRLIEGRSGRDFDAVLGPVVVCVGLAVGLVVNFVFRYNRVMREREVQPELAAPGVLLDQTSYLR